MVLSDNYISFNRENEDDPLNDVELMEITEEYKENNDIDGGYIAQSFDKIDFISNTYDDITVITVISGPTPAGSPIGTAINGFIIILPPV